MTLTKRLAILLLAAVGYVYAIPHTDTTTQVAQGTTAQR